MKNIIFKILAVLALVGTAGSTNGQGLSPGRSRIARWISDRPASVATAAPSSGPVKVGGGAARFNTGQPAYAEAVTPDIQALADGLQDNPQRIFNYVHDHIQPVFYFGSKKGAELTLLERSGNDFDQCALLSALLTAAGQSPGYQFGVLEMPYDSSNHQDLHHWLGLSLLNTNWANTTNYFAWLLGTRGYPVWFTPTDTNTIAFQRVWVTLTWGGTNYLLDPAFKDCEPFTNTLNLTNVMVLSTNTLLTNAGGTHSATSVTGLNEAAVRGALQNCNSNLLVYLSNNAPNASVGQVFGGQQIVSSAGLPLTTSLPFATYTDGGVYPILTWTVQPTNFMCTFTIGLGGTNYFLYTPQLEGQRLSLTFSNNGLAQLWQDDALKLQTTNTGTSSYVNVGWNVTLPYGGWSTSANVPVDGGLSWGFDENTTNSYLRTNASYALLYSFEASPQWLQARRQKLDAYVAAGYTNGSRQVTTETLNVMGMSWMEQTAMAEQLVDQQLGQLRQNHYVCGRMAQEQNQGYYVDVYMELSGLFPATGYNTPDIQNNFAAFDVGTYFDSAFEHGVIEQLQNSNLLAASTVKMLELAATNSQAVYLANSNNWTAGANVRGSLTSYDSTTLSTLDDWISLGAYLMLPKSGSNYVTGTSGWAGHAYLEWLAPDPTNQLMGMYISGGYHGGYVDGLGATINSPVVQGTGDANPAQIQPAPVDVPAPKKGDPVNMADGSFQIDTSDLSLGQTEPRGLNLGRHYSSDLRYNNFAGMADGWLHNYYINLLPVSAPEAGLGATTPPQMAPMVVATCAAIALYNDVSPDPRNWTVTALIAKWGIDQLIANGVSISMGKDTIEFVKQPDGSYTAPANNTMTLAQSGGAYTLRERRGRQFQFGTNYLLTNIVDPYGQTMKLTYNASNWVSTITDWTNRTLTFTYSGSPSHLTSVADSAGRTVSYGYTANANGQLDLTSYTDPESKTSTYAYDTNHEVIATSNAASQLVVTNIYNGFGRIATQYTMGSTNRTWRVYWNGYDTAVVDPVGAEEEYYFDDKARTTGFLDALGNMSQTFYDGQDHVIATISPLNETNLYIYDANHNVLTNFDPLGYTNSLVYDSQNGLIKTIDPRGNATTFGYNTNFSLTGTTNAAGDWTVYSYNANGTLHTRQDAAGTTTYGYDSVSGALNNVSYPGSLGSESFANNALGDATNHTSPNGFATAYAYNKRRQLTNTVAPTNLTASLGYDAVGNLQTGTDARSNTTTTTWSATRQPTGTTYPSTAVVSNVYDARDGLLYTIDPMAYTNYFSNNLAGETIVARDQALLTNTFKYDADGRMTNTADAAAETTVQTYNARGELTKVVDAAGGIVGKTYDPAGNLIYLTNRNTNVWQFQYDAANRVTNTISPTGKTTVDTYTNGGLLASVKDAMTQTTTFTYDGKRRLTQRADNVGTLAWQYDADDNVTVATNVGSGAALTWGYDAYARPIGCTNAAGYVIKYGYDANGNLTNLTYPGNLSVGYMYDSLNRLTNVTDWAGRIVTNVYDLDGNLTTVARPDGTERTVGADGDGEPVTIIERYTAGVMAINYEFLSWTNHIGRPLWEFDAPLPHAFTPPSRTMTYDADNRLANINGNSVTMDADGNMTSGPGTNITFLTYSYNARNQLTGAGGITYGYDPAGNRTLMTNGSVITTNVIDPLTSQLLMRIRAGLTNYYVYGAGLLYEIDVTATTTNTLFYHYDSRGSTIALTDGSGNITDRMEYGVYGMATYRSGASDTPFLYNGRYGVQTDGNGLLFMRARYYNPYICRFVSADPSGFAGGLNQYAFADGNPVNEMDPFGLDAGGDESYSLIGHIDQVQPDPLFPSGPFPYYNGTGLGADLFAQTANIGTFTGNLVDSAMNAGASFLGMVGDGMDSAATAMFGPGGFVALGPDGAALDDAAVELREIGGFARRAETAPVPRLPGPTVDSLTGQPVGRFIGNQSGPAMIEPVGGRTVGAGRGGVDTHTLYPNGANYQRLNPVGHPNNPTPHAHGHALGTGPGMRGQGASLDTSGNVVPRNSAGAHWPFP